MKEIETFLIRGGCKLKGEVRVSGAKNVTMKVVLAGLLTDEEIIVTNAPLISSVHGSIEIVRKLGVKVKIQPDHTLVINGGGISKLIVPLELGGLFRTATMVIGPLLARFGRAIVPNPGGCRIGKRPIDRHIEGLKALGAEISYKDGYFEALAGKLHGGRFTFPSNTHTGTETLILAAVLAKGETVLENAAQEPEVDDLLKLLNRMGARVKRIKPRTIVIHGVSKLHGTQFEVMPDRNEVVTFALGAIASNGDVIVDGTQRQHLKSFLDSLDKAQAGWTPVSSTRTRFYFKKNLHSTDITTRPHPGFMTDWQAPWTLLMTQAKGISSVHETIYENRFSYVEELKKMGAHIEFHNISVPKPATYYNFNWNDRTSGSFHAIKIHGCQPLHNAVLQVNDLRAGATLVLAAAIALGQSYVRGVEHIDRGYENIEGRFSQLGMKIKRIKEIA